MDDQGRIDQARSASTQSFLASLSTNFVVAGVEFVVFCVFLLVPTLRAVYQPRTFIPPQKNQAPPLARNTARALWQMVTADPEIILHKNGVDPYLFIRFLRMMVKMIVPIWLVSWVVLLPADSVNSHVEGKVGLDKFTFGNVAPNRQGRLWAHLWLAYVFNAWIMYLLWMEMRKWLNIRQAHLVSPTHKVLPEARTVLITGIPKEYMDEASLEELFSYLPGRVERIWLNRDLKDMPELWERRLKACAKLESAEVALIKKAHQIKQAGAGKGQRRTEPTTVAEDGAELSLADELVPKDQRPTMRLKPSWSPFGLGWLGIGEKVDTITWARNEIVTCTDKLTERRDILARDIDSVGTDDDTYPPLASAFIMFSTQIAAHMAQHFVTYDRPYRMSRRYIDQSPRNVIWRNMGIRNNYEVNVRTAISYAINVGMIIGWSTPVAFIGAMSNVSTLTKKLTWLSWIQGDSMGKKVLQGVISGILPPVLLALLMMILPAILRQLATLQGLPTKTEVELNVMNRYFIFLVIHVFIVITLSSGLISSVQKIAENPSSIATTLAQNLPTASTFFITLLLTQFTGAVGNLLSPITLVLYYVRVILGGATPRNIFHSRYTMPEADWGTTFPNVTVYAVIMLSYMIISPIISGFGAAFSALSYVIYKYQFIWQVDQPAALDTGGLFFPKAIRHVFVGLYIQEVSLCALFFLARNEKQNVSAIPQAALMIVLIVVTAVVNWVMSTAYEPLRHSLPLSLAKDAYGTERERKGSPRGSDERSASPLDRTSTSQDADVKSGTEEMQENKPPPDEKNRKPWDVLPKVWDNQHKPWEHKAWDMPKWTAARPSLHPRRSSAHTSLRQHQEPGIELSPVGKDVAARDAHFRAVDEAAIAADEREGDDFAQPGGPGLIHEEFDDGNDPRAFFHPATKEPQRTVWLPADSAGLAAAEIQAMTNIHIAATFKHARMDDDGRIHISGPPPDDRKTE